MASSTHRERLEKHLQTFDRMPIEALNSQVAVVSLVAELGFDAGCARAAKL